MQAELWQTNSILVSADGQAIICGPEFTSRHVTAACEQGGAKGQSVHLLITHIDFDHLRAVFNLPDAMVFAGIRTARLLGTKATQAKLRRLATDWGVSWPGEPHVDRTIDAGSTVAHGPIVVKAIEATGHTADGLAYVLPGQELFLPGDYLSEMTYPLVTGSLGETIRTYERLLSELDRNAPRLVVPGHGARLTPDEARVIGQNDLRYLRNLNEAARSAVQATLSPGPALLHVYAVEPPRRASDDFEVLDMRTSNARMALAEARDELSK
jgi:glyoxylase-like metal-dependent hydrolase (beta-lactamase superfamily II)